MTPHLEACLSGGGRIGQVGIGRNNLLKPVRRASCKRILSNYPGIWRARNCDGKYGRRPFKKRTPHPAAAFKKNWASTRLQLTSKWANPSLTVPESRVVLQSTIRNF